MKNLSAITLMFAACVSLSADAQAGHESPLSIAASQYRDAVVDFERQVLRARYIDRRDVRLVDDLEDTTSLLRSAARNLDGHSLDRFNKAWRDVSVLQRRVKSAIFGRSCYPSNPTLARYWAPVKRAYADLLYQTQYFVGNGNHYDDRHVTTRLPVIAPSVANPAGVCPLTGRPLAPANTVFPGFPTTLLPGRAPVARRSASEFRR